MTDRHTEIGTRTENDRDTERDRDNFNFVSASRWRAWRGLKQGCTKNEKTKKKKTKQGELGAVTKYSRAVLNTDFFHDLS